MLIQQLFKACVFFALALGSAPVALAQSNLPGPMPPGPLPTTALPSDLFASGDIYKPALCELKHATLNDHYVINYPGAPEQFYGGGYGFMRPGQASMLMSSQEFYNTRAPGDYDSKISNDCLSKSRELTQNLCAVTQQVDPYNPGRTLIYRPTSARLTARLISVYYQSWNTNLSQRYFRVPAGFYRTVEFAIQCDGKGGFVSRTETPAN